VERNPGYTDREYIGDYKSRPSTLRQGPGSILKITVGRDSETARGGFRVLDFVAILM
jgi:hypothetical protein